MTEKELKLFEAKEEFKIVRQAQKDKRHFGVLYSKYYPVVSGYISKRVGNKEMGEDLTSKAFEKALKGIDNFQWQGVSFKAWIFRIARNVLNDYYRSVGRKPKDISFEIVAPFTQDKGLKPEDVVIRDQEEIELYQIMSELEKDDQYLLYYKFFEGLTNVEIAKITGLSETNVGTRLYRIRNKMKEVLKNEELEQMKI